MPKAQVSMEYLSIIGFALMLTIPLIVIFFSQSTSTTNQVNAEQSLQIARKIVDNAEDVYFLGQPSKRTIRVFVPENVEYITIAKRAIIFGIETEGGISEIPVASKVNLTGNLTAAPGINNIVVESRGSEVFVSN